MGALRDNAPDAMTTPLAGRTVLVVDDDAASRETLTAILEFHGAVVLQARDGDEALHRLGAVLPDLVVTDIKMPRTSGIDLLRTIRRHADPAVARLPIIGITGVPEVAAPMWEAEFDDVLLKPIRAGTLRDAIVRHLARSASPR
jgi:CheY-like chemotaxis protein